MKIKVEKLPQAIGKIDVKKLKEELAKGTDVYPAVEISFSVIENEIYTDEQSFFDVIYAEIDWGTFFRIVDKSESSEMILEVFPVEYEDLPVLRKDVADGGEREYVFKLDMEDGKDFMIVGKVIMKSPDAWIDTFISRRVYDPIENDWNKTIIDLNGGMDKK